MGNRGAVNTNRPPWLQRCGTKYWGEGECELEGQCRADLRRADGGSRMIKSDAGGGGGMQVGMSNERQPTGAETCGIGKGIGSRSWVSFTSPVYLYRAPVG
jgi:hypothetical protein